MLSSSLLKTSYLQQLKTGLNIRVQKPYSKMKCKHVHRFEKKTFFSFCILYDFDTVLKLDDFSCEQKVCH